MTKAMIKQLALMVAAGVVSALVVDAIRNRRAGV